MQSVTDLCAKAVVRRNLKNEINKKQQQTVRALCSNCQSEIGVVNFGFHKKGYQIDWQQCMNGWLPQ